jgi:hypothetical protein
VISRSEVRLFTKPIPHTAISCARCAASGFHGDGRFHAGSGHSLVAGMLVNLSATDPLIFTAASLFHVLVALVASYLPTRRASKVDPIVALRHQ